MAHLWKLGYAAEDIIGNIFRVTKSMQMSEELKLDFIKVDVTVLCHLKQIEKIVAIEALQSRVKTF
jgi:replication factor C subunit 2/4